MTQSDEIKNAYQEALTEVGSIEPRWVKQDGVFVFDHEAYPFVVGGGPTKQEAINSYKRALRGFISDRVQGKLTTAQDRLTSGRGGRREGAGRPKSEPTKMVRLPVSIADWIKENPNHLEAIRKLAAK